PRTATRPSSAIFTTLLSTGDSRRRLWPSTLAITIASTTQGRPMVVRRLLNSSRHLLTRTRAKEVRMRLGFNLPQIGSVASPEAIARVAKAAEDAGYEGLWTTDRLLYPANPRTPYAGTPDGSLPAPYRRVIDPLDALTWAGAAT